MKMCDIDRDGPLQPMLIVGGDFASAGGIAVNSLAMFDPVSRQWSSFGTGVFREMARGWVGAIATTEAGDLIVGGNFTSINGVLANSIARWDGATWMPFGSGINGTVQCLLVTDAGELIAGGSFVLAGGSAAKNVARWNGSSWSAMDTEPYGLRNRVRSLVESPTLGIIAAGDWGSVPPSSSGNGAARWNGTHWVPLTPTFQVGQMQGLGRTLLITRHNALLCGTGVDQFGGGQCGGSYSGRLMSWSQTNSWNLVGGANEFINCLMELVDGRIVVGGLFDIVGNSPCGIGQGIWARGIALYADGVWSSLGEGTENGVAGYLGVTEGDVRCTEILPNGNIVVGGNFSTAGNTVANKIAEFSLGESAPRLSQHPASQVVCSPGTVEFRVRIVGVGPVSYVWRRDGQPLDPTSVPSALTAELSLVNVGWSDRGQYDCIVANQCGSVISATARLFVDLADIGIQGGLPGHDRVYDNNDFIVFVDAFLSSVQEADVGTQGGLPGADGVIDQNDFIVFVNHFFFGC